MDPTTEHAEQLLAKLRGFSRGLAPEERALLGALVAPGIAQAISVEPGGVASTSPAGIGPVPAALRTALHRHPDLLAPLGYTVVDDPDPTR